VSVHRPFGASWGVFGASWGPLWGSLGPLGGFLGALGGLLGGLGGAFGISWEIFEVLEHNFGYPKAAFWGVGSMEQGFLGGPGVSQERPKSTPRLPKGPPRDSKEVLEGQKSI